MTKGKCRHDKTRSGFVIERCVHDQPKGSCVFCLTAECDQLREEITSLEFALKAERGCADANADETHYLKGKLTTARDAFKEITELDCSYNYWPRADAAIIATEALTKLE